MTRHAALRAALDELTAALEDATHDGPDWRDAEAHEDVVDVTDGGPEDDAATRRAVLEELRGL